MAMRIHEFHPSFAHYPLVLFPLSIVTDLIGCATGNRFFNRIGKTLMPIAAASGGLTAAAGLVAQEAVEAKGEAHDLLITHRNLNAGLVGLTALLAVIRLRSDRPGVGYLVAGVASAIAMNYTAYLGGSMVYEHGLGVAPAGGIKESNAPEVRAGQLQHAAQVAGRNVVHAVEHAAKHLKEGDIAPALRNGHTGAS